MFLKEEHKYVEKTVLHILNCKVTLPTLCKANPQARIKNQVKTKQNTEMLCTTTFRLPLLWTYWVRTQHHGFAPTTSRLSYPQEWSRKLSIVSSFSPTNHPCSHPYSHQAPSGVEGSPIICHHHDFYHWGLRYPQISSESPQTNSACWWTCLHSENTLWPRSYLWTFPLIPWSHSKLAVI